MNVDRSPMWIGLADLLLCILSVVIVAVAPTKAKVDGGQAEGGISDHRRLAGGPRFGRRPLARRPREEARLLWVARDWMRIARSRQSWLFDLADHARRRVYGAVGIEQGNGDDPVYRARPL
jgi:hypothetical protein